MQRTREEQPKDHYHHQLTMQPYPLKHLLRLAHVVALAVAASLAAAAVVAIAVAASLAAAAVVAIAAAAIAAAAAHHDEPEHELEHELEIDVETPCHEPSGCSEVASHAMGLPVVLLLA